jgi:signal transduction histidine kinase
LDHIPELIEEIAGFLSAPADVDIAANTLVMTKADEFGRLRFEQRASVHQLLREYQLFSDVLEGFIETEVSRLPDLVSPVEALRVARLVGQAVRTLEQQTIDRFVRSYMEQIEQQTAHVRAFTRFVSHEVRQPLGVLHLLVKMLPTHIGQADSAKLLHALDRNVARLTEVIDHLERLTRLNRPADDLPSEQDVSLSALVTDVVRQIADMTTARDVRIVVAEDLPSLVLEPARAELVFVNLLANAVKYSDPAKPVREVYVESLAGTEQPTVLVRDNGIGIPRERLDAIFRQFVRVHAERDTELGAHGLGLGLAIVRECMDACHGTVTVESEENVGTTFTLTWPAR